MFKLIFILLTLSTTAFAECVFGITEENPNPTLSNYNETLIQCIAKRK